MRYARQIEFDSEEKTTEAQRTQRGLRWRTSRSLCLRGAFSGGLKYLLLSLLLFLLTLPSPATPVAAQSESAAYWQYATAGALHELLPLDFNQDGVDEFLIVTEGGQIDLIGADGSRQWSYLAGEPILAVAPLPGPEGTEIVLGVRNRLLLLSGDGEVVGEIELARLAAPSTWRVDDGRSPIEALPRQYDPYPVALAPFKSPQNESTDIVVLLRSGQVQRYSRDGRFHWSYDEPRNDPAPDGPLRLLVEDMDGDSVPEILLGFFDTTLRFSQLVRITPGGEGAWTQSVSGRLTTLATARFTNEPAAPVYVAVGNNLGQIVLYDKNRRRLWPRTVNKPVTALTMIQLPQGRALAVGTTVGSVIVFNRHGRRMWTNHLDNDAKRPVVAFSTPSHPPRQDEPVLAAILATNHIGHTTPSANMLLLGTDGRLLNQSPNTDGRGLSRLLDVNRDGKSELLLVRFPTLELQGLGIGVSDNVREWAYSLDAEPSVVEVVDFDKDGEDELLLGAKDGRLHRIRNNGDHQWVQDGPYPITHLALLSQGLAVAPDILLTRYAETVDGAVSRLERWQANGRLVWETSLDVRATSLATINVDDTPPPEVVVGLENGQLAAYSAAGERLWQIELVAAVSTGASADTAPSVHHLLVLPEPDPQGYELLAAAGPHLFKLRNLDTSPLINRIATLSAPIDNVFRVDQSGRELSVRYVVVVEDGALYGLSWRGIEMAHLPWPLSLEHRPTACILTNDIIAEPFDTINTIVLNASKDSLIVATAADELSRLVIEDSAPDFTWTLTGLGDVTGLYCGDLDGDALPDAAIGNRQGKVRLYSDVEQRLPALEGELTLSSGVHALAVLHRSPNRRADLVVIAENGLVQLFRAQENRPPLLTKPAATAGQGQYSVSVSVLDVEQDDVTVRLDIFDPDTNAWVSQDARSTRNGRSELFWSLVNPAATENGVSYRFYYDDGAHQGFMQPPSGPMPVTAVSLLENTTTIVGLLSAVGAIVVVALIRQAQTPSARARRFYRRLRQEPGKSLLLLEQKYKITGGSPDFLLYLANRARQRGDWLIASLADGLFLLADRPQAGLSIITSALDEAIEEQVSWQELQRWQMMYQTTQALLEAPSITELSLLRPQLVQLLTALEQRDVWTPALDALLPILTNLRDSERVELFEDRLVYLNEARSRLAQLQENLAELLTTIEKTLATAIVRRWAGLVNAEIEELRGRAELVVTLKTKRLAPNGRTDVSVEIHNNGRAPAENIIAVLDENPAYTVYSHPQSIPFLPPGRARQLNFAIEPQVKDRFRLALSLTYDDRNQQDKRTFFGDMVHMLPPIRTFKPIANPYMPGTPLRQNSPLFYGRERLFNFIAENAGRVAQRNILILVGQRRSGKTSALLRLDQHLPDHLIPVYIDCQSLGVTPGMPALLHELAWQISDTLLQHDIDAPPLPLAEWKENPTAVLERQYLPQVREKLRPAQMLLLVFDEFEAFENLVQDGILPPTLFPYLRHLMQHSERLSFIFVGTRHLEEMTADYWSVLFNIALYQRMGYLSDEAARRLVLEPVAPDLIYDDLALDKILRVAAGHPYFLQLVCYTLVKRANAQKSGYVTISDVNAALNEMLSLGEVHFAYLWQRSTHVERALLTAVAHLMERDAPFHPEDLTQYLEQYGFHFNPAEVTTALNQLVEREIMREVPEGPTILYELRIGLVGLWAAKNKSLSKLYASNQ